MKTVIQNNHQSFMSDKNSLQQTIESTEINVYPNKPNTKSYNFDRTYGGRMRPIEYRKLTTPGKQPVKTQPVVINLQTNLQPTQKADNSGN
jgi:hypothetical protein